MLVAMSKSCGHELTFGSVELSDSPGYQTPPTVWCQVYEEANTQGGTPLAITITLAAEDAEEDRYFLESVEPRKTEPTMSAEEVRRELKRDALL